jgi:hypothetical protein
MQKSRQGSNSAKVILIPLTLIFLFSSCQKDDPVVIPAIVQTKTFLVNGSPVGAFNLWGFNTNAPVPNTDSVSSNWDFGMRFDRIIVNSNASGPGNAGVQILNKTFNEVSIAPESGYAFDTSSTQLAVKGPDWYSYNAQTRSFAPIAGKTFVFRTATSRFAKLEFLTAEPADDNGNLVIPPTRPTKIKYTFRYAYQPSGLRNF